MVRILSVWILLLILTACSSPGVRNRTAGSDAGSVGRVIEEAMADPTAAPEETERPEETLPRLSDVDVSSSEAEVDLTLFSGNMVYALVSRMIYQPDEYLGKTVKMSGTFAVAEEETRNYYACIIKDALECCASGIEFEPGGEYVYPDDFPESGTEITVLGTYDMYEENGFQFVQLSDAQIIF